jgi:uncharacterized protein
VVKIGILSDSHDDVEAVKKALGIMAERGCPFLIHAGDVCSPFIARLIGDSGMGHLAVFGNNDGDRVALSKLMDIAPAPRHATLEGRSIVVFHEPLINDFIDPSRVDLLVYGHTHIQDLSSRGDMRIVNPGALSGILVDRKTCAVYHTGSGEVESIEL